MKAQIPFTDLQSFTTNYINWKDKINQPFEIIAAKSNSNSLEFYYQTFDSKVDIETISSDYKILKFLSTDIKAKYRILPLPCSGNPRCKEEEYVTIQDIIVDGLAEELWRNDRIIKYLEFSFMANLEIPNSQEIELIKNNILVVKEKRTATNVVNRYFNWIDIPVENRIFSLVNFNPKVKYKALKISAPLFIVDDLQTTELTHRTYVFGVKTKDDVSSVSDEIIIETNSIKWE